MLLLVGLFGLFLLALSLLSIARGGNMPLVGQQIGGTFLAIVSLIITLGGFAGFFRLKLR